MRLSRPSVTPVPAQWLAFMAGGSLYAQDAGRFATIAPRMQEFLDKGEVAGVVTPIATRDRILYAGAVGKSDLAGGRKMRSDDIFWIASTGKPVTAVAVGIPGRRRKAELR